MLVSMLIEDEFPFVEPPSIWFVSDRVQAREGTRWWEDEGDSSNFRQWLDEVRDAVGGGVMPLQWAPEYIGVSKAAVHQRANKGRLTVFSFKLHPGETSILGITVSRGTPKTYDLVPITECKAWRELLRMRSGLFTEDELRGIWGDIRVEQMREGRNEK